MTEPKQIPVRLLINRQDGKERVILPEEASGCMAARLPWIENPFLPLKPEAEQAFFRLFQEQRESMAARGRQEAAFERRGGFSVF